MKKRISIFVLVVVGLWAMAQDTLLTKPASLLAYNEVDSLRRYYFPSAACTGLDFFGAAFTIGEADVPDSSFYVYGVSLALDNIDNNKIWGMMVVPDTSSPVGYTRLDSTKLTYSEPDHYLAWKVGECPEKKPDAGFTYSFVPLYDFYFHTPHLVSDTFYLGYKAFGDHLPDDFMLTNDTYDDYNLIRTAGLQKEYYADFSEGYYLCENWSKYLRGYFNNVSVRYYVFNYPYIYGIYCLASPIQDSCDYVCTQDVEGFSARYEGWRTVLTWDTTGTPGPFQIAYGRADQDPADFTVVMADSNRYVINDSTLRTDVLCAARIRALCPHTCFFHDSLWGEWSDLVFFKIYEDTTQPQSILPIPTQPLFSISPNPSHGPVSVTIDNPSHQTCHLVLRNQLGRTLSEFSVSEQNLNLDLSNLPAGTYFLTIKCGSRYSTQKLVLTSATKQDN